MTITVLKPGLETTVQDYPGRQGMLRDGVPPSGPLDDWSFRLANLLVGNDPGTAALECQFVGPTVRFEQAALIALCGGNLSPKLDSVPIPMWTSLRAGAGQVLSLGGAVSGARAYLAVSGGIDVPVVMGSRSTYVTARLGGIEGRPLAAGQTLAIGRPLAVVGVGRSVPAAHRPPLPNAKTHQISVVPGPKHDWVTSAGHKQFYATEWKLTSRSNRVGFRIQGEQIEFSSQAYEKDPENGDHPSNIIDIGYPIGGINWAGETPIILMHDCITLGGFIVPFTVPSGEFWKLAQARPGEVLRFAPVSVEEAQQVRRGIDQICSQSSIED
jgi:5-oxoprolinase (ATP-hydrolysing) subunit C